MKKEDFLKLMDGIDDRLVEKYAISDEAEAKQKQIRRQRRQRWLNQVTGCAVAAIILGVIGVAMLCASFGVVRWYSIQTDKRNSVDVGIKIAA